MKKQNDQTFGQETTYKLTAPTTYDADNLDEIVNPELGLLGLSRATSVHHSPNHTYFSKNSTNPSTKKSTAFKASREFNDMVEQTIFVLYLIILAKKSDSSGL